MTLDRRYVLGTIFGLLVAVTATMLADVLATVFFAVTVAYLLSPLREELTHRGLSSWRSSLVSTAAGVLAVVILALPLVLVIVVRLDAIITVLSSLPPTLTVDLYGASITITLAEARSVAVVYGRQLARSFALATPVLALKLTVFVMVVFALLSHTAETHRALLALVDDTDAPTEARAQAVFTLGKVGGERSRQRIDKLLDETESEEIRKRAFSAISKLGGRG